MSQEIDLAHIFSLPQAQAQNAFSNLTPQQKQTLLTMQASRQQQQQQQQQRGMPLLPIQQAAQGMSQGNINHAQIQALLGAVPVQQQQPSRAPSNINQQQPDWMNRRGAAAGLPGQPTLNPMQAQQHAHQAAQQSNTTQSYHQWVSALSSAQQPGARSTPQPQAASTNQTMPQTMSSVDQQRMPIATEQVAKEYIKKAQTQRAVHAQRQNIEKILNENKKQDGFPLTQIERDGLLGAHRKIIEQGDRAAQALASFEVQHGGRDALVSLVTKLQQQEKHLQRQQQQLPSNSQYNQLNASPLLSQISANNQPYNPLTHALQSGPPPNVSGPQPVNSNFAVPPLVQPQPQSQPQGRLPAQQPRGYTQAEIMFLTKNPPPEAAVHPGLVNLAMRAGTQPPPATFHVEGVEVSLGALFRTVMSLGGLVTLHSHSNAWSAVANNLNLLTEYVATRDPAILSRVCQVLMDVYTRYLSGFEALWSHATLSRQHQQASQQGLDAYLQNTNQQQTSQAAQYRPIAPAPTSAPTQSLPPSQPILPTQNVPMLPQRTASRAALQPTPPQSLYQQPQIASTSAQPPSAISEDVTLQRQLIQQEFARQHQMKTQGEATCIMYSIAVSNMLYDFFSAPARPQILNLTDQTKAAISNTMDSMQPYFNLINEILPHFLRSLQPSKVQDILNQTVQKVSISLMVVKCSLWADDIVHRCLSYIQNGDFHH